MVLSEDTRLEARRIFLLPQATITTNGNSLELVSEKLIVGEHANIGTIATYSNEFSTTTASRQNDKISIQSRKILGALSIFMYGLNGAPGRSGAELEHAAGVQNPKPGQPGNPGGNQVVDHGCTPGSDADFNIRFLRINTDTDKCRRQKQTICSPAPTNGTPGEDAPKAMDGENGHDGASTGDLVINTQELEGTIIVRRLFGLGGKGGLAAPPRNGGQGGAAGNPDPQGLCPRASPGADGANGSAGRNGADGKNGTLGLLVLPQGPGFEHKISVFDQDPLPPRQ